MVSPPELTRQSDRAAAPLFSCGIGDAIQYFPHRHSPIGSASYLPTRTIVTLEGRHERSIGGDLRLQ